MINREGLWFISLYCLVIVVVVAGMFVPVMEVDAAQYASISKQMANTGSYLEIYNRSLNYLDKPPLLFWLSAVSIKLFGANDFAYKLPSVLFSVLGVLSVFRLTNMFYGRRAGHIAALMFATSLSFFIFNNDIRTDTILISAIIFSVYHLAAFRKLKKRSDFIWGFAGIGIAMLAKGPLGLIVPVMALLPDAILKRQWKFIFNPQWLLGLLLVAAILAPMCYGLYTQFDANPHAVVNGSKNVSGLKFYFWTQSFGRITGDSEWATTYSNNPDWHFLTVTFLWAILPWTWFFLAGFVNKTINLFRSAFLLRTSEEYISYFGFLLPLLALSTSGYQLNHYIYIAVPFGVIIAARAYLYFEFKWLRAKELMYGGQCLMILICSGFCVLVHYYIFPEESGILWKLACILIPLLVLVLFFKGDTETKAIYSPALAVLFAGLVLNTFFYPELLRYQPEKEIHADIRSWDLNEEKVYVYNWNTPHALDFYSMNWIKTYHLNELQERDGISVDDPIWLITGKEGLQDLDSLGTEFIVLKSYESFPVTQLTINFAIPTVRNSVLDQTYFVRVE